MSGKKITTYLSTAAVALVLGAMTVQAAEIKRVRCRVDTAPARVQISVDVRDVVLPTIDVTISKGLATDAILGVAPDAEGDVEVEWESDADDLLDINDDPEGTREAIASDFAAIGDMVTATATGVAGSETVTCVQK